MVDSLEEELRLFARQQAALRRVAMLVARGASPTEVFAAVTTEVSQLLDRHYMTWFRYEPDAVVIISTNQPGLTTPVQIKYWSDSESIAARVWRTGCAARVDSYDGRPGPGAVRARELGVRSAIATPIVVGSRLWGATAVTSMGCEPLPFDAEARIQDFTDLVATAIANAENRAELIASRARIVAADNEARQRIERDLHNGAQQQLVSIGLALRAVEATALRAVEAAAPPELDYVKAQLSHAATGLTAVLENLREISRGIHPAVLAHGGLRPALKALARRSSVPVELDIRTNQRLPAVVEMAAYHVVSESLTNAAKHAHASVVQVDVSLQRGTLQLSIHDDGVGGADPHRGSGIAGLRDRVEALGGRMRTTSPLGGGTSLLVTIPIGDAHQPATLTPAAPVEDPCC
jgi:signal transduction histidine kinase